MIYEFETGDTHATGNEDCWEAGVDHKTPNGGATGIWYQRIICYGNSEADADALRDRVLDALHDEGKLQVAIDRADKAEAILLAALTVMECEGTNGYDFVADIYEALGKKRCFEHIAEQIERMGKRSV